MCARARARARMFMCTKVCECVTTSVCAKFMIGGSECVCVWGGGGGGGGRRREGGCLNSKLTKRIS